MAKTAISIVGLLLFLVVVVGAGVLIYRFLANGNNSVAVVTINKDGKFALNNYSVDNKEVFRIQNNTDKNQTIKKSSDKTTLVEVDAKSSSRELTLSENTEAELYLAGDESQKTKIKVGSPPKKDETTTTQEARDESGSTQGTTTTNPSLPSTGPENNLVFVGLALVGLVLYRLSRRLLN